MRASYGIYGTPMAGVASVIDFGEEAPLTQRIVTVHSVARTRITTNAPTEIWPVLRGNMYVKLERLPVRDDTANVPSTEAPACLLNGAGVRSFSDGEVRTAALVVLTLLGTSCDTRVRRAAENFSAHLSSSCHCEGDDPAPPHAGAFNGPAPVDSQTRRMVRRMA